MNFLAFNGIVSSSSLTIIGVFVLLSRCALDLGRLTPLLGGGPDSLSGPFPALALCSIFQRQMPPKARPIDVTLAAVRRELLPINLQLNAGFPLFAHTVFTRIPSGIDVPVFC